MESLPLLAEEVPPHACERLAVFMSHYFCSCDQIPCFRLRSVKVVASKSKQDNHVVSKANVDDVSFQINTYQQRRRPMDTQTALLLRFSDDDMCYRFKKPPPRSCSSSWCNCSFLRSTDVALPSRFSNALKITSQSWMSVGAIAVTSWENDRTMILWQTGARSACIWTNLHSLSHRSFGSRLTVFSTPTSVPKHEKEKRIIMLEPPIEILILRCFG